MDTMFMAVCIFDRYLFLATRGHLHFDIKQMNALVCTCLLIAAKFEQPKKPDFQNMVYALQELKGAQVTKGALIALEQ